MAYIYQITNTLNGKIYIGKTEFSIEKRFKEHCQDAFRERNEKRPLYAAMRKYGIENFEIKQLEETNNPNERETYWIEKLQSFKNGYNATLGGDGTRYIDYNLVIKTYQELQNIAKTAEILNISKESAYHILHNNNIKIKTSQEISQEKNSKPVAMLDKETKDVIQIFSSMSEASRYLIEQKITISNAINGIAGHIRDASNGKRKTAYGYCWKFI